MKKSNEERATKLLKDILSYEISGWENEVEDGNMTNERFEELIEVSHLNKMATSLLNDAYQEGFLDSPINNSTMESKHLKFLGNAKLDEIKEAAITLALKLK